MKSLCVLALFLKGLVLSAGATDLVPRYITTTRDGVVIRRPYFADGDTKYAIKLDSETKLSELEGGACFRFDKFPSAMVRLRKSPVKAQMAFGPESRKGYEDAARSLLPAEAENLTLVEAIPNILPINNWQSYRFTFSYRFANEAKRQSITFLDLKPTEQIAIQVVSNDQDFADVSTRAFNIVRRWHKLQPEDESAFN